MILTIAYFPPVEYFAILAKYSLVYLDASEHYQKQSYRNRCTILSESGPLDLRFPIVHDGTRSITEVKVDYSTPWRRQTEYAIETAYSTSPFFEYYRDELFDILDRAPVTLWELDSRIIAFFCHKIGIPVPAPTPDGVQFEKPLEIHPKHPSNWRGREYWQVFGDRFGFVPGLSVMDLLFNEGPESLCYLK